MGGSKIGLSVSLSVSTRENVRTEPFLNLKGRGGKAVSSTWGSEAVSSAAGHPKPSPDADVHAPARDPAQPLSCSHGQDRIARSQRTHSATMAHVAVLVPTCLRLVQSLSVCAIGGRDWSAQNEGCTLSPTKAGTCRGCGRRALRRAQRGGTPMGDPHLPHAGEVVGDAPRRAHHRGRRACGDATR